MLPDSPKVEQVYLGRDGLIAGARQEDLDGFFHGREAANLIF
jgi:hypothetical protein